MKKWKPKPATYRRLRIIAAAATIVLIIILGLSYLARDQLIIAFGIRTLNHFCRILQMIIVICLMATISLAMPLVRDFVQKKQQKQKQQRVEKIAKNTLDTYVKEGATPENTSAALLQLLDISPDFGDLVLKCQKQMKEMDDLQERQRNLISSNGARYLEGTKGVLDGVERRLCRNIWSIRNLCVVAGNLGQLDFDKAQAYYEDNQTKLKDAELLLSVSVEWINQYDRNGEADLGEVNHWIDTIEKSLKEDVI